MIAPADIPMLHRWRNTPHVAQWWQPPTLRLSHRARGIHLLHAP
ncbi:MAG UNVERIFIED_CONTAM: acetyltransferase [Anaerolineae bacterium]